MIVLRKADCYKCEYRGGVPGDTHSCCRYPGNDTNIFAFFEKCNLLNMVKLNIRAETHGVRNGWFFWPVNFDPVWLINCDGFTQKEKNDEC